MLAWERKVTPVLRVLEQRQRDPSPTEQKLLDSRPEEDETVTLIARCWVTLSSARPYAMRPVAVKNSPPIYVPFTGPIPYPAIDAWARRRGLDNRAFNVLVAAIAELDAERAARMSNENQGARR